jgi:hypothetical protein
MLPVVLLPPSVACTGYVMWYQGQHFSLSRVTNANNHKNSSSDPPDQSLLSYSAGILTLVGTYYMQSLTFPYLQNSEAAEELLTQQKALESQSRPHVTTKKISHQSQTGYMPPQSITELAKRVGPPLMLRIAATSVAFFVAGVVQTYVAIQRNETTTKRR